MQIFPSHVPLPTRLTLPGMLAVSISSKRWTMPRSSRNPTMIFGTPSRKDWAQNLSSFRSYLVTSRSFLISAAVFSSTQLMGSSFLSGLQSQTVDHQGQSVASVYHVKVPNHDNIPASTSPPMTIRTLPIPVRTTEQYCALLFTTSSSRRSISAREVGSHG